MSSTVIWKPIKGFEDTYEVSNMGEVRARYGSKRTLRRTKDTHPRVKLLVYTEQGKRASKIKVVKVETLLMQHFMLPCSTHYKGLTYIDGDSRNVTEENLAYLCLDGTVEVPKKPAPAEQRPTTEAEEEIQRLVNMGLTIGADDAAGTYRWASEAEETAALKHWTELKQKGVTRTQVEDYTFKVLSWRFDFEFTPEKRK